MLCRLLSMATDSFVNRLYHTINFSRFKTYLVTSERPRQPIACLYVTPGILHQYLYMGLVLQEYMLISAGGFPLLNMQLGVPQLRTPGHTLHIKLISQWIRACDQTHDCCPYGDTFLPTRVIEVGNSDSNHCRLICAARGQTSLGKYLALSHRWGSPDQHRKFCTLSSNIDSFRQGINIADLPHTFQDAINTTRSLGVDYLWIDSLCIVQDDPDDWIKESRLMERVYSSAYVTLAASCASGTEDGFLKPRPLRHCVKMRSQRDTPYYVCNSIDDFGRDVDRGELNKRAWVLQERALSRRTIYFTENQIYWECGNGVRCETFTTMTK